LSLSYNDRFDNVLSIMNLSPAVPKTRKN